MDTFARIVSPLGVPAFLERHWGREHLHLSADTERLRFLPTTAALGSLLFGKIDRGAWAQTKKTAIASLVNPDGTEKYVEDVPYTMIEQMYSAGFSLCFSDLSTGSAAEPIRELIRSAQQYTDLAQSISSAEQSVFASAYLAPPQSGSAMHFDRQHVFFCQVEGSKNWTISRTVAVARPPKQLTAAELAQAGTADNLRRFSLDVRPPQECDLEALTLRAGDVLYLPPGSWHQARTGNDHSFHFTLSFEPFDFFKVLGPIMHGLYLKNPEWREELRFMGREDARAARVESVGRALKSLSEKLAALSAEEALDAYQALTGRRG
jgi:hypothetical protein